MIAFIPICRRDRAMAAQKPGSEGISTIGVGSVSVTGGTVEVGDIVAVGGATVSVGEEVGG